MSNEVWFELVTTTIAGMKHHTSRAIIAQLDHGTPLRLVREPKNPYDHNAIGVWWENVQIGHIPRVQSQLISALVDHGYEIKACVGSIIDGKNMECSIELSLRDLSDDVDD